MLEDQRLGDFAHGFLDVEMKKCACEGRIGALLAPERVRGEPLPSTLTPEVVA
jgi:hypothetical protein